MNKKSIKIYMKTKIIMNSKNITKIKINYLMNNKKIKKIYY